jgi:hypothetical protein
MLVVEQNSLPIGFHVTSAQPHELKLAEKVLSTIQIPRKRSRRKNAFSSSLPIELNKSQEFRRFLRKRGIKVTISVKKNTKKKKGRPPTLGDGYKQHWKIEHCFSWLVNY